MGGLPAGLEVIWASQLGGVRWGEGRKRERGLGVEMRDSWNVRDSESLSISLIVVCSSCKFLK